MPIAKHTTCAVPNCKVGGGQGYSFHRFPRDPALCKIWCDRINPRLNMPKYLLVCSKHFPQHQRRKTDKIRLIVGAKPSLYLSQTYYDPPPPRLSCESFKIKSEPTKLNNCKCDSCLKDHTGSHKNCASSCRISVKTVSLNNNKLCNDKEKVADEVNLGKEKAPVDFNRDKEKIPVENDSDFEVLMEIKKKPVATSKTNKVEPVVVDQNIREFQVEKKIKKKIILPTTTYTEEGTKTVSKTISATKKINPKEAVMIINEEARLPNTQCMTNDSDFSSRNMNKENKDKTIIEEDDLLRIKRTPQPSPILFKSQGADGLSYVKIDTSTKFITCLEDDQNDTGSEIIEDGEFSTGDDVEVARKVHPESIESFNGDKSFVSNVQEEGCDGYSVKEDNELIGDNDEFNDYDNQTVEDESKYFVGPILDDTCLVTTSLKENAKPVNEEKNCNIRVSSTLFNEVQEIFPPMADERFYENVDDNIEFLDSTHVPSNLNVVNIPSAVSESDYINLSDARSSDRNLLMRALETNKRMVQGLLYTRGITKGTTVLEPEYITIPENKSLPVYLFSVNIPNFGVVNYAMTLAYHYKLGLIPITTNYLKMPYFNHKRLLKHHFTEKVKSVGIQAGRTHDLKCMKEFVVKNVETKELAMKNPLETSDTPLLKPVSIIRPPKKPNTNTSNRNTGTEDKKRDLEKAMSLKDVSLSVVNNSVDTGRDNSSQLESRQFVSVEVAEPIQFSSAVKDSDLVKVMSLKEVSLSVPHHKEVLPVSEFESEIIEVPISKQYDEAPKSTKKTVSIFEKITDGSTPTLEIYRLPEEEQDENSVEPQEPISLPIVKLADGTPINAKPALEIKNLPLKTKKLVLPLRRSSGTPFANPPKPKPKSIPDKKIVISKYLANRDYLERENSRIRIKNSKIVTTPKIVKIPKIEKTPIIVKTSQSRKSREEIDEIFTSLFLSGGPDISAGAEKVAKRVLRPRKEPLQYVERESEDEQNSSHGSLMSGKVVDEIEEFLPKPTKRRKMEGKSVEILEAPACSEISLNSGEFGENREVNELPRKRVKKQREGGESWDDISESPAGPDASSSSGEVEENKEVYELPRKRFKKQREIGKSWDEIPELPVIVEASSMPGETEEEGRQSGKLPLRQEGRLEGELQDEIYVLPVTEVFSISGGSVEESIDSEDFLQVEKRRAEGELGDEISELPVVEVSSMSVERVEEIREPGKFPPRLDEGWSEENEIGDAISESAILDIRCHENI